MKIEYLVGSNVISIGPVRTEARFTAIAQIEAYWEGLRGGRLMPARGEIDPRGIADALPNAFLLEKIAPGLGRLRLAGMHLNDLLGMEVRGMPLTAMFLPEGRGEIQRAIEIVTARPATARLSLAGDRGMTRPPLEAQLFLAPLRDDAGRPTRILGALQARGEIGRAPRRFTVRFSEISALMSDEPLPRPAERPLAAGFAETAAGFDGPSPERTGGETHPGAAHLRLVHDRDEVGEPL